MLYKYIIDNCVLFARKQSRNRSNNCILLGDNLVYDINRFMYLDLVVQNNGSLEGDVRNKIMRVWIRLTEENIL